MSREKIRVLIIEDDDNFRRSVARQVTRCGFEVILASDGEEGAEVIRGDGADIVLTDLRMPKRDGHSILREIKRMHLPIPAIVMSGVGEMDDVVKALRSRAVDFLEKPFEEDDLADALDRAVELRAEILRAEPPAAAPGVLPAWSPPVSVPPPVIPAEKPSAEEEKEREALRGLLRQLLRDVQRGAAALPVLDPRVGQVRELMDRPVCGVEDVLATIGRDPALAATVLKASNSSAFNTGLPITSLRNACVRLGNRRVVSLAIEAMVGSAFHAPRAPFNTLLVSAWRCSLATARVCDALARHLHRHSARGPELGDLDDLYVAALLHNAGELALLHLLGQQHNEPQASRHLPLLAEAIADGHEAFGAALVAHWKLMGPVRILAGRHHQPPPGGESPSHATIHNLVVGCWAMVIRCGFSYLPGHEQVESAPYLGPLGLEESDFQQVCMKAREWIEG